MLHIRYVDHASGLIKEPTSTQMLDSSVSDRHKLRRIVLKLSLLYGKLPTSLFVTGVKCKDSEAYKSGGFADIYHGITTLRMWRSKEFVISVEWRHLEGEL